MRAAIRADASPAIGTGHVMRCLALADELRRRDATVEFVSEGMLRDHVRAQGFPLPSALPRCDWLVVDHYALDAAWETRARERARRILAIDDLGRPHDCDILLDQNFFENAAARYEGRLPAAARRLLGPRYALLRAEFAAAQPRGRDGRVRRILVALGGTDAGNETGRVVELLRGRGLDVEVVVGAGAPHREAVSRACVRAGFRLHVQAANMAELMQAADLAVGAAGSSTWERFRLGLPAILLAIADNQEPVARALANAGLAFYSGPHLTDVALDAALRAPQALREQGERVARLVDGAGTRRVAAAMLAGPHTRLTLRPATPTDAALYLEWANDPEVRRQSLDSRPIDPAGHAAWFARRLDDSLLLLASEEAGIPVGQARFQPVAGRWQISFSLAAEFRGTGLGVKMLRMAIEELHRRHPRAALTAEVKAGNAASHRVFQVLGFARASETRYEMTP